jgi:TonB family protein
MFLLLAATGGTDVRAKTPPPSIDLESVFIMQVDGWITIDPQGKVADYQRETKVPDNLSGPINQAVHAWLFKPVVIDGAPVQAKAKMRITLAAQKTGETYHVVIDNVIFPAGGNEVDPDGTAGDLAYKVHSQKPPAYPENEMRAGVSGRVQIAVQASPDGKVINACVVQSALIKVSGSPRLLSAAVGQFEKAALDAARKWTFTVNQARLATSADTFTSIINYTMVGAETEFKSGTWHFETRTAKRDIPWVKPESNIQHVGVSDSNSGEIIPVASAIQLASSPIGMAL